MISKRPKIIAKHKIYFADDEKNAKFPDALIAFAAPGPVFVTLETAAVTDVVKSYPKRLSKTATTAIDPKNDII